MRDTLAAYLNKLLGYGVSGFRVDAAKHVGQHDLDAIYAKLDKTKDGTKPYWALEVFGGGPGACRPQAFTTAGTVLGLDGVKQIRDAFNSYTADHVGSIADAEGLRRGLRAHAERQDAVLRAEPRHGAQRRRPELQGRGPQHPRHRVAARLRLRDAAGLLRLHVGDPGPHPADYATATTRPATPSPPSDDDGHVTATDCADGLGLHGP